MLFFKFVQPADSASQDDADTIRVLVLQIDSAVLDSRVGGDECKLGEAIKTARGFRIEVRFGVPILHLAAKVDFEMRGVELSDRPDTTLAVAQGAPEPANLAAERVHRPHAGDDHTPPRHFFFNSCSI